MFELLTNNHWIYSAIFTWLGFVVAYFLLPIVIGVVKIRRLYEKTSERSSHQNQTPSFGGIAFFIVFILASSFADQVFHASRAIYLIPAVSIMFMVGLKDDLTGISPLNKILSQLIAGTFLFFSTDFQISNLNGFLGIGEISPFVVIPLSYAVLIFFINAYNLIDGIDGLAASLGILYFIFFATLYAYLDDWYMVCFSLAFVGMFIAFLRFNLSASKKIFMGDTGSLFLGFIITSMVMGYMSTDLNNLYLPLPRQNLPYFIIAVLFIPVFDSIRVFVARISEGRSPFSPDRNHIHHLLMDRFALSHRRTTLYMVLLNLLVMAVVWPVCAFLHQAAVVLVLLTISFSLSLYLRSLRRKRL